MPDLRFKGPAAYVADLNRSRAFYEGLLGLSVRRVMRRDGRDIAVAYEQGLSIWLAADAYVALFGPDATPPARLAGGDWENAFETDDYLEVYSNLRAASATFLYDPRELPWGQLGFRVADPDGHTIDISETQGTTVRRLVAEGAAKDAVAARISLTRDQVEAYLVAGG